MGTRAHALLLSLGLLAAPLAATAVADPADARSASPAALHWRVEDIYPDEAAWRADLERARAELVDERALAGDWTSSPRRMAEYLERYERLTRLDARLGRWPSLQAMTHLSDAHIQDLDGTARQFSADLSAGLANLEPDVARLGRAAVDSCLRVEPRLLPYRPILERALRRGEHLLPAAAEEIAAGVSLFADGPRIAADCLLRELPPPEIVMPDSSSTHPDRAARVRMLTSSDARLRRAAHEGAAANRHRFAGTFAALMDMGAKRDLFQARSHHFPDCLSAELARYDVEPAVYLNLVETIRGHLEPYHRYLRLRARLLHLDTLRSADTFLPTVGGEPSHSTFAEARALVQASTKPLGPEYAARVRAAFDGGWMDVEPAPDKAGLGSAMSGLGVHPYVLLNFRGDFFDVLTVTHELGHALSFDLAERGQPFATADVPWFLSELPSTCNEVLLLQYLADRPGDDRARLAHLAEFVERLNTLLFYTTQGAEFQLAVHRQVEAGGTLSAEWLDARQLELTRHYCGHDRGVMQVDEYVRSEWIRPNMLFAPFQDYFYVVGTVASLAIADRIHELGPAEGRRYVAFLEAGSSRPPLALLRDLGVDLDTPEPILRALRYYDRLVDRMEAIADRLEPASAGARADSR